MRQVCMKRAPLGITDGTGSLLLSGNVSQNGRGFGGTPGISRSQAVVPAANLSVDMLSALTAIAAVLYPI